MLTRTARFGFFFAAILGVCSFPPSPLSPLAWVCLVPFLYACRYFSPRQAFGRAYLAGLIFFGGICYWIGLNAGAPPALAWASMLATIAILSLNWAVSAAVSSWAIRRAGLWGALLLPAIYVSFEMFFGLGEIGFCWPIWALSQVPLFVPCQLCDLTGVFGLSLWVVLINTFLFLAIELKGAARTRAILFGVILFTGPWIYGALRLSGLAFLKQVSIGVVQANIPAVRKWQIPADETIALYKQQSDIVLNARPDFLVWPETAVPVAVRYRHWARNELHQWVDSARVPLLTGALDYNRNTDGDALPLNAAFLFSPDSRKLPRSTKIHLVPFGERIPGQKLFPFLGKIRLGQAEFAPGKEVSLFEPLPDVQVGCLICFEVVFPEVAAAQVRRGAQILVNLTNDGWYGNSSGPYQHLALARLRAIVTRRSIARAANTGISAMIDPAGRVLCSAGVGRRSALARELPLNDSVTFAVRYSAWLQLLLFVLLVGGIVVCRRMKPLPNRRENS